METNSRTEKLLGDILEIQRSHLEEYRRNVQANAEYQRRAMETTQRISSLYRKVVLVAAVLVVAAILLLAWMTRFLG